MTHNNKAGRQAKFKQNRDYLSKVPLIQLIRIQALVRGFLSRRRVQRVYGFKMSEGLLFRGIEVDPEKLEE